MTCISKHTEQQRGTNQTASKLHHVWTAAVRLINSSVWRNDSNIRNRVWTPPHARLRDQQISLVKKEGYWLVTDCTIIRRNVKNWESKRRSNAESLREPTLMMSSGVLSTSFNRFRTTSSLADMLSSWVSKSSISFSILWARENNSN